MNNRCSNTIKYHENKTHYLNNADPQYKSYFIFTYESIHIPIYKLILEIIYRMKNSIFISTATLFIRLLIIVSYRSETFAKYEESFIKKVQL